MPGSRSTSSSARTRSSADPAGILASAHFAQAPRRRQLPALRDPVADMFPVRLAKVEAKPDPSRRADIGRLVIEAGIGLDQHLLLLEARCLEQHGGAAVAVMIVAEISEHL